MTEHTHTAESLHALSDAAFNRVIAELDGWTVARDDDNSVPGREQWYWVLHNGVECANVPAETEAEAWDYALTPDPECGDTALPRYASDLNAAFTLRFSPERIDIRWWATEDDATWAEVTTAMSHICGQHANPARALATAWALWKQERTP